MRFPSLRALALLALWPACAPAIVTFNVNSTDDHPDDLFNGVCADAFGKCSAACITHHDRCIGSSTAEECRCAEECKKGLPAAAMAQFAPYEKCMASAVAACQ